jgi:hypothetical protein
VSTASTILLPREAVDMAKDLPNRPKREPGPPVKKVSATDRVKAKTDKVDPRFEAARQRIKREEERRARAEAARQARRAAATEASTADADEGPEAPEEAPKAGFSFNQTAQRPGGERSNRPAGGPSTKDAS